MAQVLKYTIILLLKSRCRFIHKLGGGAPTSCQHVFISITLMTGLSVAHADPCFRQVGFELTQRLSKVWIMNTNVQIQVWTGNSFLWFESVLVPQQTPEEVIWPLIGYSVFNLTHRCVMSWQWVRLRPPACMFTLCLQPGHAQPGERNVPAQAGVTHLRPTHVCFSTKLSRVSQLWGVKQLNVGRRTVDSSVSADVSDLEIIQDKSVCLFFFVFVFLCVCPSCTLNGQLSKRHTCVHCVRVLQLLELVLPVGPFPPVLTLSSLTDVGPGGSGHNEVGLRHQLLHRHWGSGRFWA